MKKLALILTLILALGLAGCGTQNPASEEDPQAAQENDTTNTQIAQSNYQLAAGESQTIDGMTFDQPVQVYFDETCTADNEAQITFTNCIFKKNLGVIGDQGGSVRLGDGCVFNSNAKVIAMDATYDLSKSKTLNDNLMKIYLDIPGAAVQTDAAYSIISKSDFTLNGTEYKLADFPDNNAFRAVFYYDNGTGTVLYEGFNE